MASISKSLMIGHFARALHDENQNRTYPFNWIYQIGYKDPTVIALVGCIMSFEGKSGVVFISICALSKISTITVVNFIFLWFISRRISFKQTGRNGFGGKVVIEEQVTVRASIGYMASREKSLYSHITESNSVSFAKYGGGKAIVQLSLLRRMWASGSSIFCTLQISNQTEVTVSTNTIVTWDCSFAECNFYQLKDIKLILLRRQNTYSNCSQSFQLMPVSSLCNVVSSTSISSLGWFDGLRSGMKENVVLELQTMVSFMYFISFLRNQKYSTKNSTASAYNYQKSSFDRCVLRNSSLHWNIWRVRLCYDMLRWQLMHKLTLRVNLAWRRLWKSRSYSCTRKP